MVNGLEFITKITTNWSIMLDIVFKNIMFGKTTQNAFVEAYLMELIDVKC